MKSLEIKRKYRTFKDDIINDFYLPVLSKCKHYFRIVGYFSSAILVDYVKGIIELIKKHGEIRLIISPYLTEADLNELKKSQEDANVLNKLDEIFEAFLNGDKFTLAASKLLIMLLHKGVIQIKVAEPKNEKGLFHEKIGIFIDENDNKIAIIGSNNETNASISLNQESFNTFCSWKEGQLEYVEDHINDFESYWNNKDSDINLKTLEEAISKNILRKFETNETFQQLVDILFEDLKPTNKLKFTPYDYQKEAVKKWLKSRKGIFKFATGAGKTKTAIYLTEEIKKEFKKLLYIIVVPDKTLVNQWSEEILLYNQSIIKCYSDNINWQNELRDMIDIFDLYESRYQFIITTNDTFFGDRFRNELLRFKENYLLIVDECHSWGTDRILKSLPETNLRLGLSATPELFFSEVKTEKLLEYFGGIIHEYSLEDAIRDKKLVPYFYYPICVDLTENEKLRYEHYTQKIVKMIGYDVDEIKDGYDKALEMLLFSRAKIIYGAQNKITKLGELIGNVIATKRLLIYCGPTSHISNLTEDLKAESITQLQAVNLLLKNKGIDSAQYTSQENEYERTSALNLFMKDTYSTLVAIKCLDEGVNIPLIERAVILASSTNPREFIQRRGRILRTYPGKEFAEIYDFIVYETDYDSIIKKEVERMYEFSRIAINRNEILNKFNILFKKYIGG